MGFPAGGPADDDRHLSGKLPLGRKKISHHQPICRFTGQAYLRSYSTASDSILTFRSKDQSVQLTPVPLVRAILQFHGYPLKIEGKPAGQGAVTYNEKDQCDKEPYTRPAGITRATRRAAVLI